MNLKYITTLLVLTIFLSACNNGVKPKEHLVEIYSEALTSIMEQDEGLSGDMKYIAIDMSNFDEVSDSEKKEILKYFKGEYKVEVMDATLKQLQEKGLYDSSSLVLDGVLLRIEKIDFKGNTEVLFEGSKYRSGDWAVGVIGTVYYKGKKWNYRNIKVTWIS
ncbi:peptide ABC transporter substrate-binding protein [Rossellomorea sp. NPDC077527]|uniref:peptide ABC transporter substrate-binding protein n=1 Tax=Rossellomorea sp. NPDC077527 TaxID=3364510 RepID=UPI0037C9CA3D